MPHRLVWHSVPIVPFEDLKISRSFYERIGFDLQYEEENYLIFLMDSVELHLARKGHFWTFDKMSCYFRAPDVDRLFATIKPDPECVISPPADRSWRMREFQLQDPFGNVLRFGQPATE